MVSDQRYRLGLPEFPKQLAHCQNLLVDAGKFVHPVVSTSPNLTDLGRTFAAGGPNFKDLYSVSAPFSPEGPTASVAVNWEDERENDYIVFDPKTDKITVENGKLTLENPEGETSENFLISMNFILRLTQLTDRDEITLYLPVIKAVEAGLRSASGQEIVPS